MPNTYEPSLDQPQPWTVWPTLGFSLVIFIGFLIASFFVSILYLGWELRQNPALSNPAAQREFYASLNYNGTFLAWNTLVAGLAGLGLIAIVIKLRKGWSYRGYLNLTLPKWSALLIWNSLLVVLLLVQTQIANAFEKKSDFMENLSASGYGNFLLLFTAVVIMAPLFEEVFFRGFMYKGLENSWLGTFGTVFITSFVWAIIHVQYDLFFMGVIFSTGLLLGYARQVTKSLWIPISMHALNNGLAIVTYAWFHGVLV